MTNGENYEEVHDKYVSREESSWRAMLRNLPQKPIITMGIVLIGFIVLVTWNKDTDNTVRWIMLIGLGIVLLLIWSSKEQESPFITQIQARVMLYKELEWYKKQPPELFSLGHGIPANFEYEISEFDDEDNPYDGERMAWKFRVIVKDGDMSHEFTAWVDGQGASRFWKKPFKREFQKTRFIIPDEYRILQNFKRGREV